MRKDTQRRHAAYTRVNAVCNEHSAILDATPGGQKTRTALGAYLAEDARLFGEEAKAIEDLRASSAERAAARRTLNAALKGVVRVGKLVDLDEITMDTMRIPRAAGDDEMIAYARGLLTRVSPYADAFVAEGMPPDNLKTLDASIQSLAAARDAQTVARQRYAVAMASIRETQARANKTVKALEGIALNTPAANPDFVAKLRNARRVGPQADRKTKPEPDPKPEPTPTPAPSSTTP